MRLLRLGPPGPARLARLMRVWALTYPHHPQAGPIRALARELDEAINAWTEEIVTTGRGTAATIPTLHQVWIRAKRACEEVGHGL